MKVMTSLLSMSTKSQKQYAIKVESSIKVPYLLCICGSRYRNTEPFARHQRVCPKILVDFNDKDKLEIVEQNKKVEYGNMIQETKVGTIENVPKEVDMKSKPFHQNKFVSNIEDDQVDQIEKDDFAYFRCKEKQTGEKNKELSQNDEITNHWMTRFRIEKVVGTKENIKNIDSDKEFEIKIDNKFPGDSVTNSLKCSVHIENNLEFNGDNIIPTPQFTKDKNVMLSEKIHKTLESQLEKEDLKYSCDICDHEFTCQCNLRFHQQSMHEGMTYRCDQCDYKATKRSSLKAHKLSKHEGVTYNCDQCDFKAITMRNLTIHINAKHIPYV